ncbi:hypothetical protein NXU97_27615 [Bacteroides xylanisolvens]|nr:hypothetical protein [Bacteroides xylanisolvens]
MPSRTEVGGNSPAGGTCGTHQKGEMGQTQSRASIPAGAGEVEKSTGGENAGHRAAYSQKKQQEEDLELLKKPKRSRGFGMGM